LSPLLDSSYVEETVRRHFQPLLDRRLRRAAVITRTVRVEIDGRDLVWSVDPERSASVAIWFGRRRDYRRSVTSNATPGPRLIEGIAIGIFEK
jgi:hypothetical protein